MCEIEKKLKPSKRVRWAWKSFWRFPSFWSSLVHKYGDAQPYNKWLSAEKGTPGFNVYLKKPKTNPWNQPLRRVKVRMIEGRGKFLYRLFPDWTGAEIQTIHFAREIFVPQPRRRW